MPFFVLEIDNVEFYAMEKCSVDLDPLIRWPWLDPCWGIVDKFVEGVLLRDPSARSAEMIVQAEPDFLACWNLWGEIIKGYYPTGEMIVGKEGAIYHVTSSDLTELEGVFAHDLFAQLIPDRVEDIDTELLMRAEEYVNQKIEEKLGLEGDSDIAEVAFRCLIEIDLLSADYRDINACIEKAMRILAQQHFQSEESK